MPLVWLPLLLPTLSIFCFRIPWSWCRVVMLLSPFPVLILVFSLRDAPQGTFRAEEERKRKKVWSFALFFRAQSPQRKDVHLSFSVHYFKSKVRLDLFVKDSWLSKIRVSLISRMGIYSDAMNLSMSAPSFWFLVFSFFFLSMALLSLQSKRERGGEKTKWCGAKGGKKQRQTHKHTHIHTHRETDEWQCESGRDGKRGKAGDGWCSHPLPLTFQFIWTVVHNGQGQRQKVSHSLYSSYSVLLFGALSPSETKDPWPPSSLLFLSSLTLAEQEQAKRGKSTEYSFLKPIDSIENTTQKKGWAPLLFSLFSLSQLTMSSGQWVDNGQGWSKCRVTSSLSSLARFGAHLSFEGVYFTVLDREEGSGCTKDIYEYTCKYFLTSHLTLLQYCPILPPWAKPNSTQPLPIQLNSFFFGTQNIPQVLLAPMWMGNKSVDTWASVYINNTQVSNLVTGGAWPWSWQKYIGPEGTRHGWMRWMSYMCVWESMCMCEKKPSWQK